MAADTNGKFKLMLRDSWVARLASLGNTSEYAGTSNTSSKVSAFWDNRISILLVQSRIILDPAVERAAEWVRRADWQGANRSRYRGYREDLQRCQAACRARSGVRSVVTFSVTPQKTATL